MSSASPQVSVLMGVYNAPAHYLDAAIQSVLGQSFADFEFVIVDDGSGSATRDQLQAWAERDRRVRVQRLEKNVGLTRALNVGLTLARGAYIARQDADDISDVKRLEESWRFLQQHPGIDAIGTYVVLMDVNGIHSDVVTMSPALGSLRRRNVLAHGSMMFRRQVFERLGGYDPNMRLSQDYELYLRMLRLHGMQIGVLPQPLYCLRQHDGSLSSKKTLEQFYFSLRAKTITLPVSTPTWKKWFYFLFFAVYDFVITNRLFLGVLLRTWAHNSQKLRRR